MKVCSTCKIEKEYLEFNRNKASKDGYQHKCRLCMREWSKNNHKNNSESRNEYARQYRKDNRELVNSKFRKYRNANKELVDSRGVISREKRRDGYYKVYHLPNVTDESSLGYVGCTFQGISDRLNRHRNMGRDTSDCVILHSVDTLEEALRLENSYHMKGYAGGLNFKERKILNL